MIKFQATKKPLGCYRSQGVMKSFFFLFLTYITQHINGSIVQPSSSICTCTRSATQIIVTPTTFPDPGNDATMGIISFDAASINPQFIQLDWTIRFSELPIRSLLIQLACDGCNNDRAGNYNAGNVSTISPPISISLSSSLRQYILGPLESNQLYNVKLSLVLDENMDSYYYEDYRIIKSKNSSVRVQACDLDCNKPKGTINFGCTSCTCNTNSYGGKYCKDPMFAATITHIAPSGQDTLDIHWHHNYDLYSDIEITNFRVSVTNTECNTTETILLPSNANETTIGQLEEEVLYSIAVTTDTTDDTVTSNVLTAMIRNFSIVVPLPSVNNTSTEPQENTAASGIVVIAVVIFIISVYTCTPLIVIVCVQKRKIRWYEAQRAAVPLHYEQPVQDGPAILLSPYNIASQDNPAYLLSNSRNNHSSLPEYQNLEARTSATNLLYANTEVDTTLLEPETQSNTSTLTYDYIPRAIQ